MEEILTIKNLNVSFDVSGGEVKAVTNLSLSIYKGEVYALVGESGCGKSTLANSVLGLNDSYNTHVNADVLKFMQYDLLTISEKQKEEMRANCLGLISQDSLTALNPTMKVGKQIVETLYRKKKKTRQECKEEAFRLLKLVQISDPKQQYERYPHQLSGGMKQRIMIAMSLVTQPQLLIADEPTTSLDVTTQSSILNLLKDIKEETALLFITHDFGVVANIADRVGVMYAGEIVEEGTAEDIFYKPSHPYTQSLLNCLPKSDSSGELMIVKGEAPDLFETIKGCPFALRCESCMNICLKERPLFKKIDKEHKIKCFKMYK